jgi:hypothetical protein
METINKTKTKNKIKHAYFLLSPDVSKQKCSQDGHAEGRRKGMHLESRQYI